MSEVSDAHLGEVLEAERFQLGDGEFFGVGGVGEVGKEGSGVLGEGEGGEESRVWDGKRGGGHGGQGRKRAGRCLITRLNSEAHKKPHKNIQQLNAK